MFQRHYAEHEAWKGANGARPLQAECYFSFITFLFFYDVGRTIRLGQTLEVTTKPLVPFFPEMEQAGDGVDIVKVRRTSKLQEQ